MHRFEHSGFGGADCQAPKPCQSDDEAKANRLLLPARQGALGFPKAPRGRAETQAQPMPRGLVDGGNANGAEGRIDGAGAERRSSGRSGRRIGRAAEVRGFWSSRTQVQAGRGSRVEVRPSCLMIQSACAAETGRRGRTSEASSLYRDWREEAAGSRKLKAVSSRGSVGRSRAGPRLNPAKPVIRPSKSALSRFFAFRIR